MQREIIKEHTAIEELGTVIYHSVHGTTVAYLKKTCQEIVQSYHENYIRRMIEKRTEIMDLLQQRENRVFRKH